MLTHVRYHFILLILLAGVMELTILTNAQLMVQELVSLARANATWLMMSQEQPQRARHAAILPPARPVLILHASGHR